jgi:hypothetical protein
VEDCRHVTGRLERDLLAAGERVVRVPPRLMAGARQAVRTPGKSDPIDALAVARAALREPNLPTAGHDQASWEVKLLVDHREHLVAERTRTINRLRWHLHQLDPDLEPTTRRLPGPGSLEARLLESGGAAGILPLVVGGLELGRWDLPDGLQEPAVVEPVDPLQGGVLDLLQARPGAASADELGLVQADDRLGQGVSTRVGYTGGDVPNATYRNHGTHAEAIEIILDPEVTSYRGCWHGGALRPLDPALPRPATTSPSP